MKNIDDIKLGYIYKANPRNVSMYSRGYQNINPMNEYDQHYGQYIPWFDKEENQMYMIETHHIDIPSVPNDAPGATFFDQFINTIIDRTSDGGRWKHHESLDWYYTTSCILTENNAKCFEPICYLPDYKVLPSCDAGEYDDANIVKNIHLWNENTINLVKKDAEKSTIMMLRKTMRTIKNDIHAPRFASEYDTERAKEYACSLQEEEYDSIEYKAMLELNEYAKHATQDFETFRAKLREKTNRAKAERFYDGFDFSTTMKLSEIAGVKNYLNRYHHEIIDPDGSYSYHDDDDAIIDMGDISINAFDKKAHAVIIIEREGVPIPTPYIVVFVYNEKGSFDDTGILSFDATKHNISLVKSNLLGIKMTDDFPENMSGIRFVDIIG